MAVFTGTGSLTLNGTDARFYDFQCQNDGGLIMDGNGQRLENCVMTTPVTVADGSQHCIIRGNNINDEITLAGNNDHAVIVGNYLNPAAAGG